MPKMKFQITKVITFRPAPQMLFYEKQFFEQNTQFPS